MEYLSSKIKDIEKFLADANLWMKFIFPTIMALGILPHINEANSEALSNQAVALVQLIMPVVGALIYALNKSEAVSEVSSEVEEFVADVKKWLDQQ